MRPYQWLELNSLGLNLEQCRREVQFVISIDEKYSGSNAFANFFVHSPSPWKVLGYILKLPGIRHLSAVIYKWVAANRYRLPGGTPTCKMPKKD
jgi:predicted DCC family thiol-disulfide oxidoreductase YuxK